MHLALSRLAGAAGACGIAAVLACVAPTCRAAESDSAYISQIGSNVRVPLQILPIPGTITAPSFQSQTRGPAFLPSSVNRGVNIAQTLTIGNSNRVAQVQSGANDSSTVGILEGDNNNVGVLQTGNGLRSTLGLINTQGLNIAVLQPPGAAPSTR